MINKRNEIILAILRQTDGLTLRDIETKIKQKYMSNPYWLKVELWNLEKAGIISISGLLQRCWLRKIANGPINNI